MNLHEYQAKQFFRNYGIKVPEGYLANNIEEVKEVIKEATDMSATESSSIETDVSMQEGK